MTNKRSDGPTLVTWGEIAAYLKCCKQTAKKWHKLRPMPIVRAPGGNEVRVIKTDLEKWLREGT